MNVQNQPHVKMAERRSLASTTRPTRDDPVSERRADAQAPYRRFDGQYIDGSWRPGRHGGVRVDTDPYSGATLAEMVMANQCDLDEAYHAAAKAQVSWAAHLPAERAAVMLRSASIMEARHSEIVDWLIRESGSTRVKAELAQRTDAE
jgi:acyl-CoA reductase-like NAD-dependent aldehyde dehydrogenase